MERYDQIANSEEFKQLRRSKMMFVWPVVLIFIAYYLTLPILAGYAKPLMNSFVVGNVTFGYLYGMLYYIVAWALAFWYVAKAKQFDEQAKALKEKFSRKGA